jgi:bla regulator protein BlaR1
MTAPSFLIQHLWQSTLFSGATAILALALRRSQARVRFWLWFVASVRFLVPLSLLVLAGVKVGPFIRPALPAERSLTRFAVAVDGIGISLAKPGRSAPADKITNDQPNRTKWVSILPATWFLGCATVLLLWWRRWRIAREAIRTASILSMSAEVKTMSTPTLLEPGVFGIWRPVLLLPAGIQERLTPAQFHAIVAHELCHIRRRDNLAAAIHMVVEAVFWFHPLVWWLGAKMIEERERACDEEVLRSGSDPREYAAGILNVCQFYLEAPLACVSGVTGADLKQRIVEIVTPRVTRGLSSLQKTVLTMAALAAVSVPLAIGIVNAPPARAQAAEKHLAFELASVKPNRSGSPREPFSYLPSGRISGTNVTLRTLVELAYDLESYRLAGGPPWLDSEHYDIEARAEAGTVSPAPVARESIHQMQLMLQTLLADRFKLKVHRETKEGAVYALVVAKGGPKLEEVKVDCKVTSGCGDFDRIMPRGYLAGPMVSVADIASVLSHYIVGRPVYDKTGISGVYKITLQWTREGLKPVEGGGSNNEPQLDGNGPSLFTALQEQLGLKLEAQKGPVETVVIDHAEKASEN